MQQYPKPILSIYPFEGGFAWAYMGGGNQTLPNMDKGIVYLEEGSTEKSLEGETLNLIWYFKPAVIALRGGVGAGEKILKDMIARVRLVCLSKDLPVERFEPKQLRFIYSELGANTTEEAHQMMCQELPELGLDRLAHWLGKESRHYIFESLGLMIAYKYLYD
jgi:hypothetical protein